MNVAPEPGPGVAHTSPFFRWVGTPNYPQDTLAGLLGVLQQSPAVPCIARFVSGPSPSGSAFVPFHNIRARTVFFCTLKCKFRFLLSISTRLDAGRTASISILSATVVASKP